MLNTAIKEKDGALWFDIEGELYSPYAYMTYCPEKKYIDEFKKAGYKIFSFPVYMCDWSINAETGLKPFWQSVIQSDGSYDFSCVDKFLEMFSPGGNDGFIFPRVFLQTPSFWDSDNPEELFCDYGGERIRCDFTSEKARGFLWKAFKALIDHIEDSPWKNSVIGYQIAGGGTEEWAHVLKHDEQFAGYGVCNRKHFVNWLKVKYITVENLNNSWQKNYKTFEEAELPLPAQLTYGLNGMLRDSKSEMQAIDFHIHHSEIVAETILYFADKVKTHTLGKAITGAFYGYIWMFHKAYKGHNALNMLLKSPVLDFVASTNGWPEPGLSWPFGSAPQSALLHKKIFMCEGDIRTHLTDSLEKTMPWAIPDGNTYYTSDVWRAVKDEFHSKSIVKKAMARVVTSKVGMWWFDMFSGWFSSPEIMNLIRLMPSLRAQGCTGTLSSQVALVLDEDSPFYTAMENGKKGYFADRTPVYNRYICDAFKTELGRMGTPYDIYEAKDLANPDFEPDKYKLYIFPDMVNPSPEVQNAIETRIKGGGRTLFWNYFADASNSSCITDFKTHYSKQDEPLNADFMGKTFPAEPVSCPRFAEEANEEFYTILNFKDSSVPCVKYKKSDSYQSFYCLLPAAPAKLLMEVCLMAGVHLYSRDEDVIYAGGNIVAIHSDFGGTKHLLFPKTLKSLVDAETGEEMKFYDSHLFFTMEKNDTRIFKVKFI